MVPFNWCDRAEWSCKSCIFCIESLDTVKEMCPSTNERGLKCTREEGHTGLHVACCGHEEVDSVSWLQD